jgi:hypothetical protein
MRRPSQPSHDGVHGFGQWGWSIDSASTPGPARARQGPEHHVDRDSPWGMPALELVPLDLIARGTVDLEGVATLDACAGFAVGPGDAADAPAGRSQASIKGLDQLDGTEVADPMPGFDGGVAEGDQEMALAGAGRTDEADVLLGRDPLVQGATSVDAE